MNTREQKKRWKEKMRGYSRKKFTGEYGLSLDLQGVYTNDAGYKIFLHRNFSFKGDRFSWVRIEDKKLIIRKAKAGKISEDYHREISNFCSRYGIDFDKMKCGDTLIYDEKTGKIEVVKKI